LDYEREEKGAGAPKRVVAFGASRIPNSSSNIEIVVGRRLFCRIETTLCDAREVLEEKGNENCSGMVMLFGSGMGR
jgi:hypothetical protein